MVVEDLCMSENETCERAALRGQAQAQHNEARRIQVSGDLA